MKAICLKFILAFCSVLYASGTHAQYNWKLSKDRDGIKVFESATGYSSYRSLRVECSLQGSIEKLIEVLTDISHHKDWIYNNKDAYLLKRINAHDFYYYTETYLPWPMSNRDVIAHMKISRDTLNHSLDIVEVGEPGYMPEKDGIVRVPRLSINWHVIEPAAGTLAVTYILEVEPGGSVPAWISNMFADKGPYESFRKLGAILKQEY